MEFVEIENASVQIGSEKETIKRQINFWKNKLIKEEYSQKKLMDWFLKEYPPFIQKIESFKISKYPVTNSLFEQFCKESSLPLPESISLNEGSDHPVWGVDQNMVLLFLQWFSQRNNSQYRLPTEFEWEYAAAGPNKNQYPFGNQFDSKKCNTKESKLLKTTPVDYYSDGVSHFGLYDMAGNVEELTISTYKPYPNGQIIKDDLYHKLGMNYKILKGGSCLLGGDLARCSRRHGPYPDPLFKMIGFRIIKTT